MSVLPSSPTLSAIARRAPKGGLASQRNHYNKVYSALRPEKLARDATDPAFLEHAIEHHTSWHGLYRGGFEKRLQGKRVLEIGGGDGLNALIMARLGAEVTVFEISQVACETTEAAADLAGLRVTARCDDFLNADLQSYDFIVGKAFLHHLPGEVEADYLAKIAEALDQRGEARFVEPAVNSRLLDQLRFMVPVVGRPSSLQRERFREWQARDPHPDRPLSTSHFREAGRRNFGYVRIEPFGGLKRLERFFRGRESREAVGKACLQLERRLLPVGIASSIARTQLIVLREPKRLSQQSPAPAAA